MVNVDTDMIIPKQFLKTIKRTGLGKDLFDEMRSTPDGSEIPDFVLNKPPYRKAKILVAGANFGCGSIARARALGAARFRHPLRDRAVVRRHLLQQLLQERHPAHRAAAGGRRQADGRRRPRRQRDHHGRLEKQEMRGPDGGCIKFEIDAFRKQCLLNGLDDIGLTMQKAANIDTFEAKAKVGQPWLW